MFFFLCFFSLAHPTLEYSRIRKTTSYRLKKHKNLHVRIFTNEIVLYIWVKWKQSVGSISLLYSSTFYSLFLPFFVLEIFEFKHDRFFVIHSASLYEAYSWRHDEYNVKLWQQSLERYFDLGSTLLRYTCKKKTKANIY